MNTIWYRKFTTVFAFIAILGVSACGTLLTGGVVDINDDTYVTDQDG